MALRACALLAADEMASRLGHISTPLLAVFAGADEYVPASVDQAAVCESLLRACGKCRACSPPAAECGSASRPCPHRSCVVYPVANHALDGHEFQFVEDVVRFLAQFDVK